MLPALQEQRVPLVKSDLPELLGLPGLLVTPDLLGLLELLVTLDLPE